MAGQPCLSEVLQLNGFGWLNVLMSIGKGHLTQNLPTKLPTKFCLPTKSDNLSGVFAYQILCHILAINHLKMQINGNFQTSEKRIHILVPLD